MTQSNVSNPVWKEFLAPKNEKNGPLETLFRDHF